MKRTFTKYPSNYIKADSDFIKRFYVYYGSKSSSSTKDNLLNAKLNEALERYGVSSHFGRYNSECRSYYRDACLCIVDTKKPISKAKLKSVIENELDLPVYDIKEQKL